MGVGAGAGAGVGDVGVAWATSAVERNRGRGRKERDGPSRLGWAKEKGREEVGWREKMGFGPGEEEKNSNL